jgi:hypothetical protein
MRLHQDSLGLGRLAAEMRYQPEPQQYGAHTMTVPNVHHHGMAFVVERCSLIQLIRVE